MSNVFPPPKSLKNLKERIDEYIKVKVKEEIDRQLMLRSLDDLK